MPYVLAAALLLVVVALLVLRPLFAPSDPEHGRHHSLSVRSGGGSTDGLTEESDDALEAAIAERRALMAEREAGHR